MCCFTHVNNTSASPHGSSVMQRKQFQSHALRDYSFLCLFMSLSAAGVCDCVRVGFEVDCVELTGEVGSVCMNSTCDDVRCSLVKVTRFHKPEVRSRAAVNGVFFSPSSWIQSLSRNYFLGSAGSETNEAPEQKKQNSGVNTWCFSFIIRLIYFCFFLLPLL